MSRKRWLQKHEDAARAAGKASWQSWVDEVAQRRGRPVCGGMNRNREPCGEWPMRGRVACYHHNGGAKRGPEHPSWKHGEHSIVKGVLSAKLAENYANLEQYVQNAFSLTAQARVTEARWLEVLESIAREGGHVTGLELRVARDRLRRAVDSGEPRSLLAALGELDALVTRSERSDASWREYRELTDLKRRLAETHTNQKAKEHGPVNWTDVALVSEALKRGILRFVPRERIDEYLDWFDELRATTPVLDAMLATMGPPADA